MHFEKRFLGLFAIVLCSISVCSALKIPDVLDAGNCPVSNGLSDFDTKRFEGVWYIANQPRHALFPDCQAFNFTATSGTSLNVSSTNRQRRNLAIQTEGKAHSVNPSSPSSMALTWSHSPMMTQYMTIVDTDYGNYANVLFCDDYFVAHMKYGLTLTRQRRDDTNDASFSVYVKNAQSVFQPYFPRRSFSSRESYCFYDEIFPSEGSGVTVVPIAQRVTDIVDIFKSMIA